MAVYQKGWLVRGQEIALAVPTESEDQAVQEFILALRRLGFTESAATLEPRTTESVTILDMRARSEVMTLSEFLSTSFGEMLG